MPLLRPADAHLVRRDRDFQDLGLLLDNERLSERIDRTLGGCGVDGVTVRYLRYKPGQSCLAACQAIVDGQPVDFVAKAHRSRASDKFHKASARTAVAGPLGRGRFVLADSTVIVSVFPNDQRLKHLARLASGPSLSGLAARLGADPSDTRLDTLRHNPERRFVGRLSAGGRAIASVRCYAAGDYAAIAWKADALRSQGPLRLARRLARRPRWHVLAFEWLHGELLDDAIRGRAASPAALRSVGAALARLHGQEAPALPRRNVAADAAAFAALARQLAFLQPEIAESVRVRARRVAARVAVETTTVRAIHGDFYANQVLIDPAGEAAVAFIDLDEASLGDPAIDLGRFRADLEARVVAGGLDASEVEPLVEPLLDEYRRASGGLPANLNLQVAAQLFRLAAHPFRRRQSSWPSQTAALLERAEAFLERDTKDRSPRIAGWGDGSTPVETRSLPVSGGSPTAEGTPGDGPAIRVVDPFGASHDPLLPFLARALNPDDMAARFASALTCLDPAAKVHVRGIAVTRHKPGRRCLIAYDLAVEQARRPSPDSREGNVRELAVMGKVRARGADRTTHDLVELLWTTGFGEAADDRIHVPEPLGIVPDLHLTAQRRVPGETLTGLLEGPSGLYLARRAAEAIHKLHRLSPPTDRTHTVDDEIRILRDQLSRLSQRHPRWRARLSCLLDGCISLAALIPTPPRCGIHRDFYPEQVLVDGERLYLIDLDLYSHGDPALDVGNFVAHVEDYSLRRFADASHLADRTEMMIERYLQLSHGTTREVIHVWTTLSLARLVAISELFAERRPFTPALLDLCERRLFDGSVHDRATDPVCDQGKGATP